MVLKCLKKKKVFLKKPKPLFAVLDSFTKQLIYILSGLTLCNEKARLSTVLVYRDISFSIVTFLTAAHCEHSSLLKLLGLFALDL